MGVRARAQTDNCCHKLTSPLLPYSHQRCRQLHGTIHAIPLIVRVTDMTRGARRYRAHQRERDGSGMEGGGSFTFPRGSTPAGLFSDRGFALRRHPALCVQCSVACQEWMRVSFTNRQRGPQQKRPPNECGCQSEITFAKEVHCAFTPAHRHAHTRGCSHGATHRVKSDSLR